MEAISARKDEKPVSRAASLNLPGDSALEVEGVSGQCPEGAAAFPDLLPPLGRIPFGPLRGRRGLSRSLLAFPSLPCIQGEGGTVRTGKFFVTLSRDAFLANRMRV